jgi:spore coat protein U-like protein
MILRALILALAMLVAGPAMAACTLAGAVAANFAGASSYTVRAGGVAPVAAPASLSCSGAIVSVFSGDEIRATTTSTNGFLLKANGIADTIPYRLSADQAGSVAFTQGGSINYMDPSLLTLLGILNSSNFVPPVYAGLTASPNVPAGTYTDTVTIAWRWRVCRGVGVSLGGLQICVLQDSGSGTTTLTVTLVVSKDCRVSAPALSFGAAPLASQFVSVTQPVVVDCTKNASFNVAFTAGRSGASRPWRTMRDDANNPLQYNIYRPDGTTIWDESNALIGAGTGTGSATPTIFVPYVAKINPAQPTPPAGSYTDQVSVVVTF